MSVHPIMLYVISMTNRTDATANIKHAHVQRNAHTMQELYYLLTRYAQPWAHGTEDRYSLVQ